MLDFNDFFYFVQVVDRGGFTAAGGTLRIPKSTLSHRIQQLEANLGVRLLNRTCAFHKLDSNERVVKSTQVRHARDRSDLLNGTAKWGILVQGKVRARLIVV